MARVFHDFFVTVASDLVEKLLTGIGRFGIHQVEHFYSMSVVEDSFRLFKVRDSDICKILKSLNPGKATGLDNLPARFVSDAAETIACPLIHIINLSIQQGLFPNDLKLARVIPICKRNSKTEVGNYHPVSVLNVFSKVFVHNQLYKYLQMQIYFTLLIWFPQVLFYWFMSIILDGF